MWKIIIGQKHVSICYFNANGYYESYWTLNKNRKKCFSKQLPAIFTGLQIIICLIELRAKGSCLYLKADWNSNLQHFLHEYACSLFYSSWPMACTTGNIRKKLNLFVGQTKMYNKDIRLGQNMVQNVFLDQEINRNTGYFKCVVKTEKSTKNWTKCYFAWNVSLKSSYRI